MKLLATLALIVVTALWGGTFVVVQKAVSSFPVIPFLALRFGFAAAALAPILPRRPVRSRTLASGGLLGLALASAYLLQTFGLLHTSATRAGLITGLFVVGAPVVDRLFFATRLAPKVWVAVACCTAGMALISGVDLGSGGWFGDLLCLGCAICFSVHIVGVGRLTGRHDPFVLTFAQLASCALIFAIAWPLTSPAAWPNRAVWLALIFTGVACSAAAYLIQTWAQRHLSTARTALLLITEPIFAALFGFLFAGDRLLALQWIGGALILASLLLTEVPRIGRRRTSD